MLSRFSIIYHFYSIHTIFLKGTFKRKHGVLTKTMTSLVARANISAHETLFRQLGLLSSAALALMTVSNPSPASD